MVFQDAMVEFGFDCKVRKLSPRSIDNYQKQLRYFQTYLADEYGIKNVEQVKAFHIKQFLGTLHLLRTNGSTSSANLRAAVDMICPEAELMTTDIQA